MAQGTWNAPEIPGSDISTTNTGNYAIYNVKADAFMGEGMNYNTEAIACRLENGYSAGLANRQKFTLTVSTGTVKMVHANHTDRGVGCASTTANDIYADYASNNVWTFTASSTVPDYGNVYTLSLAGYGTLDVESKWGGKLTIKSGKGFTDWAFIPEGSLTDGSFAKWVERKAMYDIYLALVASSSTSTYASALETANAVYVNGSATVSELRAATRTLILATAAGIQRSTNVSSLFTNANMQQDGTSDWTSDNVDRSAGAIENHWACTAITLTQEKTDLPNGMYTLVFRGMYRTGSGDTPYFKAVSGTNDKSVNLPLMSDVASTWSVRGTGEWAGDDNNKIPDKLWRAAEGLAYEGASAKLNSFKVTGNTLSLTVKVTSTAQWVPFQCFDIFYDGPTGLALYNQILAAKATAEAIDGAKTTNAVQTALDNAISGTTGLSALSEEDGLNDALDALNTAIGYYEATKDDYASYNAFKANANAIAAIEYKETTSGSHTTFANAITTQTSAVEGATAASTITTAISTLKAAIKTYISGAEPKNEEEYFDITCLMVNPNFDDSHNGWTYIDAPGVNWSNCEYYQKEFDINQTVTGLPNGSYSLKVQAFQRPGWAGDVYNDYIGGTDNASSVLYINSITSKVKNIAADAQASPKLDKVDGKNYGDWPYDSQVGSEGSYKYVPNSQQGAKLYFDAGLYDATCAAVVTDADGGSLKLGFKSTKTHVSGDWTIFDNFRLYYYGSSLLVYYQQYWPQLKDEVEEDLANAAYTNVLVSSEDEAVDAALAATPSTESQYETAIDNLTTARDNFHAAKLSYDAMVEAQSSTLTKISANIGTGVFQYNETTNNTLYSAYESTKDDVDKYTFTTSSTAAGAQALVDALNTAIANYNDQALNAPDAGKRYVLTIVEDGKAWNGNAITFIADGRSGEGGYAIKYLTPTNSNLNQTLKFTVVAGETNTYKVSAINAADGGERYITTGSTYEGNNTQIRTTDDASKASWIKIKATSTSDQFQLLNVSDGSKVIANNNNNDMYTANSCNFTIAEASQANVTVQIASTTKYATLILPFAKDIPDGVKAYSCDGVDAGYLTLTKVNALEVNKPYILFAEGGLASTEFNGWGVAGETSYTEGLLTGVYADTKAPAGSFVLQKHGEDVGLYKVATGEGKQPTVGANHAYLRYTGSEARLFFFNEGETTGIDAINALTSGEAEIYNASGVQIPALQNGMNIVKMKDGSIRKIMVK